MNGCGGRWRLFAMVGNGLQWFAVVAELGMRAVNRGLHQLISQE